MHIPRARFLRVLAALLVVLVLGSSTSTQVAAQSGWLLKLDSLLQAPEQRPFGGRSRVLVRLANSGAAAPVQSLSHLVGGEVVRNLPVANSIALDLPNAALPFVAGSPLVVGVSLDRVVVGAMERTGATIGATAVRQALGFDGSGVGVAIIDSGVAPSHDDLADPVLGGQRVDAFVDLVNGQTTPYDDYGHGTHVAGIIGGTGFDSGGARAGIAPGARLIVLKVLDDTGSGHISDVIAALDYVVANKDVLNIRIVNLSVATGVYESYETDPLTQAAKRAVDAGIVVVAAAGNNGRGPTGITQYGGITAPGNAPWVLTVGASSHMGTTDRADDTMAIFSSRGPGAIDYAAKPDLVAPGVGLESLSDPASWMYTARAPYLLNGTVSTSYLPYLSLSGTSMAAPVVTGTVALMLQANPTLTPNAVKAILQYTAQEYAGHDALTQGAGFVNAKGAVELAQYLAAPATTADPTAPEWSRHIIWGNYVESGGVLTLGVSAWAADVTWGAASAPGGQAIVWGVKDDLPWQAGGPGLSLNVVWASLCGGADCFAPWSAQTVFGTGEGETETVVWGTSDGEGETVVWGTSCADPSCEPVVWNP